MAQSYEFYLERAADAKKAAQSAELDNVRDRELRAEKTWLGLAKQARKITEDRAKAQAERDERREAEAASQAESQAEAEAAAAQ